MYIKKKKIFYKLFKNFVFLVLLLLFPTMVTFLETIENIDLFDIIFDDETSFFSKEALPYHKNYFFGLMISLFFMSSIFFIYFKDPYNISSFDLQNSTLLSCKDIDQLFFLLEDQLSKKEFFELLKVLYQLDTITSYKYFAINYINNMLTDSYLNDFSKDPYYVRKILIALIIEIESQYY